MTDSHSTPTPIVTQQLALEIQIGEGNQARLLYIQVPDVAESLRLQELINKTPGKLILGKDTPAPMTIHCGRVLFMNTVLLPPQSQITPPSPKIATLRQ